MCQKKVQLFHRKSFTVLGSSNSAKHRWLCQQPLYLVQPVVRRTVSWWWCSIIRTMEEEEYHNVQKTMTCFSPRSNNQLFDQYSLGHMLGVSPFPCTARAWSFRLPSPPFPWKYWSAYLFVSRTIMSNYFYRQDILKNLCLSWFHVIDEWGVQISQQSLSTIPRLYSRHLFEKQKEEKTN